MESDIVNIQVFTLVEDQEMNLMTLSRQGLDQQPYRNRGASILEKGCGARTRIFIELSLLVNT